MLRKKLLYLIAFSLLLLTPPALSGTASANPALRLMGLYSSDTEDAGVINPYTVNIVAVFEVTKGRHLNEIREYILWYFNHLNYPDREGLTGTIYDYRITETGEEVSTVNYDSVDGYAGTFLYLLNLYHRQTHDDGLIAGNWEKIQDIAYLLPYLQDEDGLTKALFKDKDNVKYLMDNCESYAGLKAFNDMADRIGRGRDPYYAEAETGIKIAVLDIFYDNDRKILSWAVDDKVKHDSDWTILYPDAIAQLFPIYFGLLDEDDAKRNALWEDFDKRYGKKADAFPMEQNIIYELTRKKMSEKKGD